ncbi:YqcC family protein [Thiohalobacter sp. IOR34]|uniref:YqcC family protein n=1 Tax=Thiohalobacter sp. IOR34 TaxID=3057176 RepID=UPI0025B02A91|nr:YqcC family protein [Thiohalobacter sp. IOR34]WJW75654.1 YqcC family protein [Thiohalobacter sp. IOR34]
MSAQQLADLLDRLEAELRRQRLWEANPPSAAALASPLPFCHDTLAFHQWLQWVLIPRLRALLDAGRPLPHDSAIAPMGEEMFRDYPEDTLGLQRLLVQIDACLTGRD